MDSLTVEARSRLMANVKGKDTKPEMVVRRLLHSLGYRYRLHVKKLPATPDLVFAGRRKVIFVHGCFWHRHEGCSKATFPKSRQEFWGEKFRRNTERDRQAVSALEKAGWKVLIVWQCQLTNQESLATSLVDFLEAH
jgi:DNA mismatch endonuclease (patch repair protein)